MKIQEQIYEWFNCSESFEEKAKVIKTIIEISEDLLEELNKKYKK
jgi:hypothetical protein